MLFLCAEHGDRRFHSFVVTGGIVCCSNILRCRHLTAGLSGRRYFVSKLGGLWQYTCWCLVLSVFFPGITHIWVGQWPVGYSAPGRCLNHYWPIVSKKVSIIVWYCNHIKLNVYSWLIKVCFPYQLVISRAETDIYLLLHCDTLSITPTEKLICRD